MGMRIIKTNSTTGSASAIGQWQQRRQSFRELFSNLQNGTLQGAGKAYAKIAGNPGADKAQAAVTRLGHALQSSNLPGSRQAAAAPLFSQPGRSQPLRNAAPEAPRTPAGPPTPANSAPGAQALANILK